MNPIRILAINPGSTSTKIAVFEENQPIFAKSLRHSREEIAPFTRVADQYAFRKQIIIEQLKEADIDLNSIHAVVGRGGLLKPIPSGVYEVNERMKQDLMQATYGEHASNLGGLIADDIAQSLPNAKAFITNPVVVDELSDVARIAGHPLFERKSIFHALNQKAVAESHCRSVMKRYEDLNLIVIHLGGGISVGAHCTFNLWVIEVYRRIGQGLQLGHVLSDMEMYDMRGATFLKTVKFQLGHVLSDMEILSLISIAIFGVPRFQLGHVLSDMEIYIIPK